MLRILKGNKISGISMKIGLLIFLISFFFKHQVKGNTSSPKVWISSDNVVLIDSKTNDTSLLEDLSNKEKELSEKVLNADRLYNSLDYDTLDDEHANFKAFENALNISFLIILSFLINIPFFIRWAKLQKGSKEVLFYNVEGKFTYLSIILWIEQIERLYNKPLIKERKKIEKFYNIAQKGGQSIKIYKRKIHDILLIKAFGKNMVRNAFNRMDNYSKVVFIWDWAIYFSVIYCAICLFSIDTSWVTAVIAGVLAGNIVAAPLWLICHLIFNHSLKKASRKAIKKGGGLGMRIIMAQFYGAFGGIVWKDLYYIQGRSSWTVGGFIQGSSSSQGYRSSGYSTGWTHDQSNKDLDFDEK